MRIFVVGRSGQVAQSLLEVGEATRHEVIAAGRPDLDLADPGSIGPAIANAAPDVVINAAAYTAVDKAETEREAAFRVNGEGPGRLAEACCQLDIPIVHISTDYVFDGSSSRSYLEADPVAPLGVYGESKRAGEEAVRAAAPKHFIFRTAWVYSPFGSNFVKTMLRLAETRDEVSVVDDQIGNPTSALDIATGIIAVVDKLDQNAFGTYHMSGNGIASWADLAKAVFSDAGKATSVKRIRSEEFPTPAPRPLNSRLDCSKLEEVFGLMLPDWRNSVRVCVRELTA